MNMYNEDQFLLGPVCTWNQKRDKYCTNYIMTNSKKFIPRLIACDEGIWVFIKQLESNLNLPYASYYIDVKLYDMPAILLCWKSLNLQVSDTLFQYCWYIVLPW